jgi:formate dehydrogenase iron-sulfur subunit
MDIGCLVDTTRCTGCRSCQAACKQSNGMPAEKTRQFAAPGGYQNPPRLSPKTRTLISYHELEDRGQLRWVFVKRQCMHCRDAPCAAVCGPQAFSRTPAGIVVCDSAKCIGCAACMDECPFAAPTLEYKDLDTPQIRKCDWCLERQAAAPQAVERDGRPLAGAELDVHRAALHAPACARACPTGAIQFGLRAALLAEAHRRIAAAPDKYIAHVYGEKELGGMGWLYLAAVPFEEFGFPREFAPPAPPKLFGQTEPPDGGPALASCAAGAALLGLTWVCQRRDRVRREER